MSRYLILPVETLITEWIFIVPLTGISGGISIILWTFLLSSSSTKKQFYRGADVLQLVEHSLCIGDISSMADNLVS